MFIKNFLNQRFRVETSTRNGRNNLKESWRNPWASVRIFEGGFECACARLPPHWAAWLKLRPLGFIDCVTSLPPASCSPSLNWRLAPPPTVAGGVYGANRRETIGLLFSVAWLVRHDAHGNSTRDAASSSSSSSSSSLSSYLTRHLHTDFTNMLCLIEQFAGCKSACNLVVSLASTLKRTW